MIKNLFKNLEEGGGDNIGDNVTFVNKEESSSSDSDYSSSGSEEDSDEEVETKKPAPK